MRPLRKADNLTTFLCPLSWNLGTLTSWNPLGHSRPVTGLIYLLLPPNLMPKSTKYECSIGLHRAVLSLSVLYVLNVCMLQVEWRCHNSIWKASFLPLAWLKVLEQWLWSWWLSGLDTIVAVLRGAPILTSSSTGTLFLWHLGWYFSMPIVSDMYVTVFLVPCGNSMICVSSCNGKVTIKSSLCIPYRHMWERTYSCTDS